MIRSTGKRYYQHLNVTSLLADLSGKTPAEIAALDMGVFAEAVFTLMASEDFRDFFTRLMKRLGQTK